jgi:hypothetical protein
MTGIELALLALAAAAGWFAWDSLRVREAANAAMRAACEAEGLLFLDDTVALVAVRPVRHPEGHLALQRTYEFEFSDTGHNRRQGSIVMLGAVVDVLELGVITGGARPTLH